MKVESKEQDKIKNRGSDQNENSQPVKNDQAQEKKERGLEGTQSKKKFMDRVRRGYPDGPGGSYDGF